VGRTEGRKEGFGDGTQPRRGQLANILLSVLEMVGPCQIKQSKLVQEKNAALPRYVTEVGIFTPFSKLQSEKAEVSTWLTVVGIIIDNNDVHL
jgi:hypothetical protein